MYRYQGIPSAGVGIGFILKAALFAGLWVYVAACATPSNQPGPSSGQSLPAAASSDAQPVAPSDTPLPLWQPDYPRDLDHIRETLGAVFLPTYLPDGYKLSGATVHTHRHLLEGGEAAFEAGLGYATGFRGIDWVPVGEFYIYQQPEGWNADVHKPYFNEVTVDDLTLRTFADHPHSPAFLFQADGRWLWISVFGEPEMNVDMHELVKIAKSFKRFGKEDPVDWLTVVGITQQGFENNPLVALDDFAKRGNSVYVPSYLPSDLGLHSASLGDGGTALKFEVPSHLTDGKQLNQFTLGTAPFPVQYRDHVEVNGSMGYVFKGRFPTNVILMFKHDDQWFKLDSSAVFNETQYLSVLDELVKVAESLSPHTQS